MGLVISVARMKYAIFLWITVRKDECGFKPTLPSATILGNIYTVGSDICYEYQDGYVNVGGQINCSICSETGVWTAVNIQCELPFVCDDNWVEYDSHCNLKYTFEKKL